MAGWANIVKKFTLAITRIYTKTQMKNKYDSLMKEFRAWLTLNQSETGLVWDYEKGTVTAPSEWWTQKLIENLVCAKFRDKGPILVGEQHILFDDIGATGDTTLSHLVVVFCQL